MPTIPCHRRTSASQAFSCKSWLATLIHAPNRCFGDDAGPEHWRASPGAPMLRDGEAREPLRKEIESFVQSAGLKVLPGEGSEGEGAVNLSGPLLNEIRALFEARGSLFGQEIGRCLGLDDGEALSRRGSGASARIVRVRRVLEGRAPCRHELTFGARGADFKGVVPDPFRISNGELQDVAEDFINRMGRGILKAVVREEVESDYFNRSVITILEKLVRNRVAGFPTLPAHYLPADRAGVLRAHPALVGGVIRNTSMAGRRHSAASPVLTGVLADFLNKWAEISSLLGESE